MPIESKNMIHKIMWLKLFKNHIRLVFRPTQILPNKTDSLKIGSEIDKTEHQFLRNLLDLVLNKNDRISEQNVE